ncbi:MAG: chemotaxis protein CheB [Gaiellaceae bacterium]
MTYELIAIGTSWGGLQALSTLLGALPDAVEPAIVIVQHRSADAIEGGLSSMLQDHVRRPVREVEDKAPIELCHVYVAPPDYHTLVEPGHFALSTDERVQFSRPSVDVLFDSVADAYAERAIGIVLTGANADGAAGLARIKERGGVAIVEDPGTATRRAMPDAAIAATIADAILPVAEIPLFLQELCG